MLLKIIIPQLVLATSALVLTPAQEQKVEKLINDVLACGNIPSMTVGIVKEHETWMKGFGEADVERHINVDATRTRFSIGSLTKAFTTTLLAMLLEQSKGRYTWDTKVTDILGKEFKFVDEERTAHTTLKDIVTHRTGLNTVGLNILSGWYVNTSRADFVKRIRFLPEVHAFRDRFEYNNWMYALAGYVVGVLSGESWEVTLQKKILDPLGMTSTRVYGHNMNISSDNLAQPYIVANNRIQKVDPQCLIISPSEPAGAIFSTAADMLKWVEFHMRGGKTADGRQLVSARNLGELYQAHVVLSPEGLALSFNMPTYPIVSQQFGYGYAWFASNYRGYRSVWHGGRLAAYTSVLQTYPDIQVGIYISQTGPDKTQKIAMYLTDILLGEDPWLNATTICSFPAPWVKMSSPPDPNADVTYQDVVNPERYVGTYGHRFMGEVIIESRDNLLSLRLGSMTGTMHTTSTENLFKVKITGVLCYDSLFSNSSSMFPISFNNLKNGKFTELDINYPEAIAMQRDLDFYGPFPPDTPTPTCTNTGTKYELTYYLFLMLIITMFLM